jgi:hypothetical protein
MNLLPQAEVQAESSGWKPDLRIHTNLDGPTVGVSNLAS